MSEPQDTSQAPATTHTATKAPARTATSTTAPTRQPTKPKQLPPFRVLLHNDDQNERGYVAATIHELTPHSRAKSVDIMWRAERRGVALLLVTHRERAELYRDQFRSKGLVVTIEPAGD
ncbi:MAG: ATP-dependent Clp protease adaptor ClpS [Planctomycetota bacterium]